MSDDDFELVQGSGNVFRDLGLPNPEVEQLKAVIATKIISELDDLQMTVRRAHEVTGFAAADFSRIRNAQLRRFTLDRLIAILGKLDSEVEVEMTFKPRKHDTRAALRSA